MDSEIDGLHLVRVIGRGGSAMVYEARDPRHGRRVAVKVLEMPGIEDRRRRAFRRELQAMGRLGDHPYVVDVFDSGFTVDGSPYLVMPLVEGGTVAQRIRDGESFSIEQVLDFGVKIGSALETAHRRGILHCDIKPSNLFLGAFSTPLLGDLGISSVSEAGLTTTSQLSLTIMYAAPEIIENETHSVQSDIYSLGASIFALTDMTAPFTGESTAALIRNILSPEMKPELRRPVPDGLATLIREMMALAPDDRPQTALEVVHRFQGLQAELGFAVTEASVSPTTSPEAGFDPPTTPAGPADDDTRSRRAALVSPEPTRRVGRRLVVFTCVLLLAGIAAFAAWGLTRGSGGESSQPAETESVSAEAAVAVDLGSGPTPTLAPTVEPTATVVEPVANTEAETSNEPSATQVPASEPAPLPSIVAESADPTARIDGVVGVAEGGPATSVEVDLFVQRGDGLRGDFVEGVVTDAAGAFTFDVGTPGCYVLTYIAPDGFVVVGGDAFLEDPFCVDDTAVRSVDAEIAQQRPIEASIVGRVLRSGTSAGVGEANVDLFVANDDQSRGAFVAAVTTDADGNYQFDVPTGCYIVTFVAPEGLLLVGGDEFLNASAGCLAAGESVTVVAQVG